VDALRGGFGPRAKETRQQQLVSAISSQKVEEKS
jgi:hypothetical protein